LERSALLGRREKQQALVRHAAPAQRGLPHLEMK